MVEVMEVRLAMDMAVEAAVALVETVVMVAEARQQGLVVLDFKLI